MASPSFRRLEQQMVPSGILQRKHPPEGATYGLIWYSKKRNISEVMCEVHLKSREHTENRMQCFHQGATNLTASSGVLFSKLQIHQIWEDLFLKEIKIICSVRQDLNV